MIKLEHFYSRFDEVWEVTEKCNRIKGYDELRVVNWRNLASPVSSESLSIPPLEIKILFFLQVWQGQLSEEGLIILIHLKMFTMSRCHILG